MDSMDPVDSRDSRDSRDSKGRRWVELLSRGAPAIAGVLVLVCLHAFVNLRLRDEIMAAGINGVEQTAPMTRVLAYYLLLGAIAVGLLAWGLVRLLPHFRRLLEEKLGQGSDRSFMLAASLLAFALGAVVYQFLLQRMPLTDDENVYRVAAQILAEGRLYLPVDQDKDFFVHTFLVNDGKYYTQYFLGWPALMLPALLLGLEAYANAFYFALTVPAVFLILRRLAGSVWARLGVILLIVSPMVAFTAGTLLSHNSCLAALAWFTYCALRCREDGARWYWHSATAALFSIAFLNRPLTAIGLGLPILLVWLWDLRRSHAKARDLVAFATPAVLAAGVFFWINNEQSGHPLRIAYESYLLYMRSLQRDISLPEVGFISLPFTLSSLAVAFFRLNFAAFGWPVSWLFVGLAGKGYYRRILLAMVVCFFAANLCTTYIGIDTYAPMHFIEMALPMTLLTALGLERATRWATELEATLGARARGFSGLPLLAAVASVLVAFAFLIPHQARTLWRSGRLEMLSRAGIEKVERPAVVFVKQPYANLTCYGGLPAHWVHQFPINRPGLQEDLLWLAHIDLARDRELMARRFPERKGYLVAWHQDTCRRYWVPLEAATEAEFPPDRVRIYR